jgi:uroporphyrinogen decarboxylase
MEAREIVRRAIEFDTPPRLPFWQHWNHKMPGFPDDICNIWEMDRARAGWFFDNAAPDDWGCVWGATEVKNMGQVTANPLASWSALERFRPPDPLDPFCYERLGPLVDAAGDRYVAVTAHNLLFSRLHKLRGFAATMEDFYLEPERVERVLDMIVDFKVRQCEELHRRFGDRIHGLFVADDWGTQSGPFVSRKTFDDFFAPRYRAIFDAIHDCGWHVILHSCGRINSFVSAFIELGVDVLNMQQSRSYGSERVSGTFSGGESRRLENRGPEKVPDTLSGSLAGLVEFGQAFRGKVCFLATVDIQSTMPRGIEDEIREEARLLVRHWGTSRGGLIAFDYGHWAAVGVQAEMPSIMFDEFARQMDYWQEAGSCEP